MHSTRVRSALAAAVLAALAACAILAVANAPGATSVPQPTKVVPVVSRDAPAPVDSGP